MARVPDIMYQGQLSNTEGNLYVVPSSKKATITAIHVTNCDTATRNFTLHLVQNGSSASDSNVLGSKTNKIVGTDNTGGGGFWLLEPPIPLNTVGDKISGSADVASKVTVMIIGFEEAV